MGVPTSRYVAVDLADFGRPSLSLRRCWLAVPAADPLPVRCSGCRRRFESLTSFELHIREQEMAVAG